MWWPTWLKIALALSPHASPHSPAHHFQYRRPLPLVASALVGSVAVAIAVGCRDASSLPPPPSLILVFTWLCSPSTASVFGSHALVRSQLCC
uniref:Uncharacterized protein n=1 Tax=Physcomitrium patens TaxID=3218 RepID=A0A2K1JVI1_PHYPA|nr:hypothetical protein PHYPA_015296 [Physcomitrium patens]